MTQQVEERAGLILAAEECEPEEFERIHRFSKHDETIIRKLIAHGPVLLRGGRGSGKSALMIAASRWVGPVVPESTAIGIYLSMRYLPLLRSTGPAYEAFFCEILSRKISEKVVGYGVDFAQVGSVAELQYGLSDLASKLNRRIVLFFDDAAHIGREASLQEFFDLFRTLSSSAVSCKAAIYPGVTHFGTRFDVYNDATTIDVARSEEVPGFGELFEQILEARFPGVLERIKFSREMDRSRFATFLAQSVLGNMRAFVFAMHEVSQRLDGAAGLHLVTNVLVNLASNYYWPLLEELKPKLGIYAPMLEPAQELAELFFEKAGGQSKRFVLVHRELVAKLAKPLELLEYAGFISRRDVSRAMKSGGRGTRYALSLCNLLEQVSGARITQSLFSSWLSGDIEFVEFHRAGELASISIPAPSGENQLGVFELDIEMLAKSPAYPYGLTEQKISVLRAAGLKTVGELAEATDVDLLKIESIGEVSVQRIKLVVAQSIWM